MGFLYCPSCGKEISELAVIPACPNCFHPFNAKVWRKTQEQKIALERARFAEENKKEEQSRTWQKQGRCPECGGELYWSIRKGEYNEHSGNYMDDYDEQYCKKYGCRHSKNGIPVKSERR